MRLFEGMRIGVANRGIPALRIGRTIREMQAVYVAFYTASDKMAPHVAKADRALELTGNSYLALDEILRLAREHDVQALHPGWGFAAEDDRFPRMCRESGIIFIGPSAEAMRHLGNKVSAIRTAREAGVPVVPGSDGAVDLDRARTVAGQLGYPVLIKSEGGGGGRGIVLVRDEGELERHFRTAGAMAEASFGNPNLFIEKFLERVRHLEIQVLRDRHGHVVALDERDCSLQRKNQKLLEVTPSPWPGMTPRLRQGLKEASIALVEACDYDSIATIEFLVTEDGEFYFIEANTRLQVEHGITELLYDIDIVEQMIRIACDQPLALPAPLEPRGHALQCRINFEDPTTGFRPNAGRILRYLSPGGEGVRLDSCVFGGYEFPTAYDSAGALLMAHAATWSKACAVMERALSEYIITGPKTTIPFHRQLLADPGLRGGAFDTKYIERTPALMDYREREPEHIRLAYLMAEITAHGYNPYLGLGAYRRFGDKPEGGQPVTYPHHGADDAPVLARPVDAEAQALGADASCAEIVRATGVAQMLARGYTPPFHPLAARSEVLETLRASPHIELCNTTARDITQSESSNRMRLHDDRRYGPLIDQCGYVQLETGGGAHYHVNMLGNMTDPWHEAEEWNCFAPFTQKMILVRSTNLLGYAPQGREVMQRTTEMIVRHYQVVRCFDFLNHVENMEPLAEIVLAHPQRIFAPAISFSWAEGFDRQHYLGVLDEILAMIARVLGADEGAAGRRAAAREIVLVIKDMAGVAPPRFIRDVVTAFRDRYPDLVIQYHRHNTDGLGVPALGAAAVAGARILDVGDGPAVRFYGQPAVLPVVAYLEGELGLTTRIDRARVREAGFVLKQIMPLYDRYVRPRFLGPDHDVVHHGLPGGATSSSQEAAVKQGYAFLLPYILEILEHVRRLIRYHDVTPGSQITWTNGYMAAVRAYERGGLEEVRRLIGILRTVHTTPEAELSDEQRRERLVIFEHANDSLRNLLLGKFGRLPLGWPPDWVYQSAFGEDWREKLATRTAASPLAALPEVDLAAVGEDLRGHIGREPTEAEVINYLNHPGDALELIRRLERFGEPNQIPDDIWFEGLEIDVPREFRCSDGKVHTVRVVAVSPEPDQRGQRTVRYELDHEVFEHAVQVAAAQAMTGDVELANPENPRHIAAPFDAELWVVHKRAGDPVTAGEEVLNLSLMKMETAVVAPVDGTVSRVLVQADYRRDRRMVPVVKGQLLIELADAGEACSSCGAVLAADHRFCAQCGRKVSR